MKVAHRYALSIAVCLVTAGLIAACGGGGGSSGGATGGNADGVHFNVNLSAYLRQQVASQPAGLSSPLFTPDQILTGTLSVTDSVTSTTQVFPWSAYLDETTLETQSNTTILLPPGIYDFSLLLSNGSQQYAGTALAQTVNDGPNTISMTVQPIIGDTVSDVTVVAELADFRFQYPVSELAVLTTPRIGMILDGGTELIFDLNPATGMTDVFINLPPGPHTLALKLYDDTLQVGRSIAAQESITVSPGVDIAMDLVALQGDISLELTADGGTGTFNFTIPAAIVDEAGGVANLEALFSLSGTLNGLQSQVLALTPDGLGNYIATAVLSGLRYEDVTLALDFHDTSVSPAEQIAYCADTVTLNGAPATFACDVVLRRRAVVGGHLLATLAVNAADGIGVPSAGATILIDGNPVGIADANGFLKVFVLPGPHTVRAEAAGLYGEAGVNPPPLGIANVFLTVDLPITSSPSVVLALGAAHTCANSNGQVRCWGYNGAGQLGVGDANNRGDGPGEMGSNLTYVDLGTSRTAAAISLGQNDACALLDNGQVRCWGYNLYGNLGLGDGNNRGSGPGEMGDALPVVDLGAGRTVVALSVGGNHACAILDNQELKCWGQNAFGQLGLGDIAHRGDGPGEMGDSLPAVNLGTGRHAVAVHAGFQSNCALLDDGSLKCWGLNSSGQLGLGDLANRGDNPGEMGDALPPVDLGTGRSVVALASGANHNCALLDDGSLKCWGDNSVGQLGLGDTNNRGDAAGEMGDSLPAVNLGTGLTASSVFAGATHTCAILSDASVRCWGQGFAGKLGSGSTANRGINPGQMGDSLPAVDLGTGHTATTLATSEASSHTCAVLEDGSVKCWGWNVNGQLGLGDTNNRGDQPNEMGDNLPTVDLSVP